MSPIDRNLSQKTERGLSFLEFTIATPIVMLVILLFVDVARFYTAKNYMDSSVQRALAFAAVTPGLGDENPSDEDPQRTTHDVTVERIQNVAKDYINTTLGQDTWVKNLNVSFSVPSNGTISNALNSEPMTIEMSAQFDSFIPYFDVTYSAQAHGYREQKFVSTMPSLVNCFGVPVGTSGGSLNPLECPCNDDPLKRQVFDEDGYWEALFMFFDGEITEYPDFEDFTTGECECASGMVTDASDNCVCQTEGALLQLNDNGTSSCVCPTCTDPLAKNTPFNCNCQCSLGSVQDTDTGDCVCPENKQLGERFGTERCLCNDDACGTSDSAAYTFPTSTNCNCYCRQAGVPGGRDPYNGGAAAKTIPLTYNPDTETCDCPMRFDDACGDNGWNLFNLGHNIRGKFYRSCACVPCRGGTEYDPTGALGARCKCTQSTVDNCLANNGFIRNSSGAGYGCQCVTCSEKQQVNASKNGCECRDDIECEAPLTLNGSCNCVCPLNCSGDPFSRVAEDCSGCECLNGQPKIPLFDGPGGNIIGETCGNNNTGEENFIPIQTDDAIEWHNPE